MLSLLLLSKWLRRLLATLALLLVLLWFLPTLVANSPILGWLVERAAKDVDGSVRVGGASMGWLSPVVLHDVSIKDRDGAPLASVSRIESERSLLSLMLDSSDPGRILCDKAAVEVVLAKKGSNWEKALAKFLTAKPKEKDVAPPAERAQAPLRLAVDVHAATIVIHDLEAKKQWSAGPIDIKVTLNQPGQAPLQLQANAGPQRAYGCDVGPLDLRGDPDAGRLRFTLGETTLNTGKLRLAGTLRLEPEPMDVQFAKGIVIDHAQLTPALCAGALSYAMPVLAGMTEVQGLVSFAVQENHLVADTNKSELKGVVSLHSAKVGASPLIREFASLFRESGMAYQIKEMNVPIQVSGGRVHHQNFELNFPDFTVRTSGSVGFDGTVALVAEMPVPAKWLGNNPLASSLAKQTIRLPIGGTIDHPRLDQQALQAASAQFIRNAGKDVIRQGIDTNLKKLFGGR